MIQLQKTDSRHPDFIALVKQLDADLAEKDGADHSFYAQFNKIDAIRYVIVAYEDEKAVGCGAIKPFDSDTMEVKRMFVYPSVRGKGIATAVLTGLEKWATELGYAKCVLETGKRQQEAIRLYSRNGYRVIANYGQYIGVDNSVCFEKSLR